MEVTSPAGSRAVKSTPIPRVTWLIIALRSRGAWSPWAWPDGGSRAWALVGESQWIIAAAMGVLALASWVWPVVVYRGW